MHSIVIGQYRSQSDLIFKIRKMPIIYAYKTLLRRQKKTLVCECCIGNQSAVLFTLVVIELVSVISATLIVYSLSVIMERRFSIASCQNKVPFYSLLPTPIKGIDPLL
ncbi:hypothetical protein T10_12018 [Trichinella papuae]|uniref:Uncharacterized protein n=1 Tax=Trichinella papuae TaxID=268474 RepID=A0A0V1MWJ7_9BILA|nr:hypothetical protein T10_12018 [Trichinella papuae]